MKKFFALIMAIAMVLTLPINAGAMEEERTERKELDYERVEELPDGGYIYTYIVRGVEHHFPVPPDGFNPLTATDEQLETYCFPRRPVTRDAESMEAWYELIGNYVSTPVPAISVSAIDHEQDDVVQSNDSRATSSRKSYNWAGYAVTGSIYTQVQMNYVEPTIISAVSNAKSCEWVGIGGYSDRLVQAGTEQEGTRTHSAWYEYLNNNSEETYHPMTYIDSLTINAGDSIHVYIAFQKANNRFEYYIANNTTGKSSSVYIDDVPADIYYDGTTAEWIVERPINERTRYPYPLCNFESITLSNCQFTTNANNTWRKVGDYNNDKWTMYDVDFTRVLCDTSAISRSDTFTCTWRADQ